MVCGVWSVVCGTWPEECSRSASCPPDGAGARTGRGRGRAPPDGREPAGWSSSRTWAMSESERTATSSQHTELCKTILLVREGGEIRPTGVWYAAPVARPGVDDLQDVVPLAVR